MTDAAALKSIQDSLAALLVQNESMSKKIDKLEQENAEMKRKAVSRDERVNENVKQLKELNEEAAAIMVNISQLKTTLTDDDHTDFSDIDWFYRKEEFQKMVTGDSDYNEPPNRAIKSENHHVPVQTTPFTKTGREEKVDMCFGQDGDYSAKSLRRFIERYGVVKKLNTAAELIGWDSPEYRANKLKLTLHGDAFDYIGLESSMAHSWTQNDEEIILKLKDRYINIQAVELNILNFEKCNQEPKELLNEYLARLRQLVKDAYEGDNQAELDRKVAWKFVSGLRNDIIRRKLMEEGWMKNRREAKPLEDLLKMAELTKRTDEAVKATGSIGNVGAVGNSDRNNAMKSKKPDRSSEPLMCWYCRREHRGGWYHCIKRQKENPTWKPERRTQSGSGKSGTGQKSDTESKPKDF